MKEDPADSPNRTICQWAPAGTCLLCDQIHPGPNGPVKELNIFTYDRTHAGYVMQGLQPLRSAPFTIDGQTWTYPGAHNRVLNIWESPTVMHYIVQASANGREWSTNVEGRLVRTKAIGEIRNAGGMTNVDRAATALQPLAGSWQLTGTRKETALGPGGGLVSKSTCSWSPNGAFLVCDQRAGNDATLLIYSAADDAAHVQLRMLSPDDGSVRSLDGTIADRVWTFTTTADPPGGSAQGHVRVTKTFETADRIRGTEEISTDGTTWVRRAEWTETRSK
jgi:hypothetical protein